MDLGWSETGGGGGSCVEGVSTGIVGCEDLRLENRRFMVA